MKVINISGGLGNQMFQYAFALALKEKYPSEEVLIDIHHYHSLFFKRFRGINLHNGYEMDKVFFNLSLKNATAIQIKKVSRYIPNYILSRIARKYLPQKKTEYIHPYSMTYTYDDAALTYDKDCYYEGFWQSFLYYSSIKEKLRDEFMHPMPNQYNLEFISRINNTDSVGIHIRRGDYLSEPEYRGICNEEYYQKCIEKIKKTGEKKTFFIFSNDLLWCEKNVIPILGDSCYELVSGNKGKYSCWDMFLMSYCKNLVIANSSFSWWAAFLNHNEDCKVYCPEPWVRRDCKIEVYSPDWIRIKR